MQVGLRGKRQSIASAVFGEKGWGSTVLVQKKWVMKNNCLPLKNWQICWRSVHCTPQRENLPIHHKYTQLGSSEALKGLLILKNTYTCVRLPICHFMKNQIVPWSFEKYIFPNTNALFCSRRNTIHAIIAATHQSRHIIQTPKGLSYLLGQLNHWQTKGGLKGGIACTYISICALCVNRTGINRFPIASCWSKGIVTLVSKTHSFSKQHG